ncbi:sulfotransferase [Mesobaculum littorinae]|uniref:Sulfotransferase n=1 Tax=Mesobaculum littorinae TaxID=2486419 RepID=A0A438AE39_9RHOB|nr:sulfotransferase [Mesobaculum littorinae]RVV96949.1 sulfotransferase [Mesobaculum littorinae]
MTDPVVMFCTGATKAGTSWLHEVLSDHPECHFRSVKELHYFDALEHDQREGQAAQIRKHTDILRGRLEDAPAARLADIARRIADREAWLPVIERGNLQAYTGYLTDGVGKARVVGDVTPAYALLPERRLREMAAIAPDVRFVYLLRDPVARLWSHVRMIATRRGGGALDPKRARNVLRRTLGGEETEIAVRGDYAAALTRLDAAVSPQRRLVLFYEDAVAPGGLDPLCDFLGIGRVQGSDRRVHAGTRLDMTDEQRDKARDWLAPQYDFVARRMGRLPDAWENSRGRRS